MLPIFRTNRYKKKFTPGKKTYPHAPGGLGVPGGTFSKINKSRDEKVGLFYEYFYLIYFDSNFGHFSMCVLSSIRTTICFSMLLLRYFLRHYFLFFPGIFDEFLDDISVKSFCRTSCDVPFYTLPYSPRSPQIYSPKFNIKKCLVQFLTLRECVNISFKLPPVN